MRSLQIVCIIFNNVYYSAITITKGVLVPGRRGPWYRFWLSLFQTVREGGIKWRHPSDGLGTRLGGDGAGEMYCTYVCIYIREDGAGEVYICMYVSTYVRMVLVRCTYVCMYVST